MHTLVLNGSPHKNGDSMKIFKTLRKHLIGEVTLFSAYDQLISPCNDCRHCWQQTECPMADQMQTLYSQINEYDNVIIVSPLYFSELSGPLLSMCSRFQYFWTARQFRNIELITKHKKGVLIIAGAGDGDTISAERSADILFHHLKTDCIGKVFSLKTAVTPASKDWQALAQAKELAENLNDHYLATAPLTDD